MSIIINGQVPSVNLTQLDSGATLGLLGTTDSLAYRVHEIERHLHSSGSWFQKAGTPSATHIADRIGVAGGDGPFRIDAGDNTWGDWLQILGSGDTPARASQVYFDPHEIVVVDAERAATYFIQFGRGATGAAALEAGTYTELVLDTTSRAGGNIVGIQTGRAHAGSLLWARCMSPANNTSWIDFYFGLHEYQG